jgi:hypothetical protein
VLQLKGDAAIWAMHRFPMSTPIELTTFCMEVKAKYITSNALDLVKRKWEELSLKKGECITEFTKHFRHLHSMLDLYQPMPSEMLSYANGFQIEKGNQGMCEDLFRYIGMRDRTPTLEQHMGYFTTLDTSLNKFQPASASNGNMNTKASARKMESNNSGTMGTTGMAKDDGLTCYNCGQAGHISCNCLNREFVKKLLQQALVSNDVTKAKNGHPHKDKKRVVRQSVKRRVHSLPRRKRSRRGRAVKMKVSWRVF